jgi:NADPH-dependent 7-cyano-7-deazaguanine reductase QueF
MSYPEDRNDIANQVANMLKEPIEPKYVPYPLKVSGKVVKQISTVFTGHRKFHKELVSNALMQMPKRLCHNWKS